MGAFFFVERAVAGAGLYVAFLEGCGAAAAVMVLAGLAQRLHAGDRLQAAQLPGGGAQFESSEAVESVRAGVYAASTSLVEELTEVAEGLSASQPRVARLEALVGERKPVED